MSIIIPKRDPKRVRVMLEGMIETTEGRQTVRIRDISRNGLLMESDESPIVGGVFTLLLGSHAIEGTVAWHEGPWSGVVFSTPLEADVWDSYGRQPLAVSMPRQYRHDRIANDESEPVELSSRVIRLARSRATA